MIMIRNWLTLPRLLTIIVFIAIFAMAVRTPADTDTWWHLRSGQYIVETRGIPTTDPFSHTFAGQPLTAGYPRSSGTACLHWVDGPG
jgi:hypothetical protein